MSSDMMAIGTLIPPLIDGRLQTISHDKKLESVSEFHLVKGISAALFVGLTGSALALGFEQGLPISLLAENSGVNSSFAMMPVYLVILSGTFISSLIWCFILGIRNNTLKNYTRATTKRGLLLNYSLEILAGFLWFSQFIFYGMGKSKMGPFTFASWGILMALIIVSANVWGLIRKECKGISKKIYILLFLSLTIIIVAAFMIGISGSV